MKYALLIYSAPDARHQDRPTDDGVFGDWVSYTRAMKEAGVLLGAEQLNEVDTATTVRRRGGERLLTDGPFVETKEHLLGFYLIDVPGLDTALDWAGRMPNAGTASIEVRPVREGMPWRAVLE